MPKLRLRVDRADADGRLPILLRLQALRHPLEAEGRRLLRVLLLWNGPLPSGSGGWTLLQVSFACLLGSRACGQKSRAVRIAMCRLASRAGILQGVADGFETPRRYKTMRLRRLRHLIDFGAAARGCRDVLGHDLDNLRVLWRQAATVHVAPRAAGSACRFLAGHWRRLRLLAGNANAQSARSSRSIDGALFVARHIPAFQSSNAWDATLRQPLG